MDVTVLPLSIGLLAEVLQNVEFDNLRFLACNALRGRHAAIA